MTALLLLLLLFQQPLLAEAGQDRDVQMWLELGRQAESAGEYEEALRIWTDARSRLTAPSTELATDYIRLVTEQKLRDYYPMAVSFYLWGLSEGAMSESNIPALQNELDFLEPLVGEETYERWSGLLTDRNPILLDEILGYWESVNPVPDRPGNPRLLEHWERIAYVREHFTRGWADATPYGTDDRGTYYVKYGEPNIKDEGVFQLFESDVSRVMRDSDSSRTILDILYTRAGAPHRYEYWIYYAPNEEMTHNLVLMFGERSRGGYGRLYTMEDLLPNVLFTSRRENFDRAAMAIQEIYYDQLATKDHYFNRMYHEILTKKRDAENGLGYRVASQNARRLNYVETYRNMRAAPEQISAEEKSIPEIPIDITQYRLLDEAGNPVLLSFVESRPTVAFLFDQGEESPENEEERLGRYRLTHGLRLSDEHRRTISRSQYRPDLYIDPLGDTPSSSVFTLSWLSQATHQHFYAELSNTDPDSPRRFESLIPEDIRGLGRVELPQPEPLPLDGTLLLGDLILGYEKRAGRREGALFDFVVANDRQVPEGEPLVVHFELYHLEQNEEGVADFEITYEIRPVQRILLWDRTGDPGDFSLTLSFRHDVSRFAESLEIETQGLEPGRYELTWKALDLNSGEETAQEIRFEIIGEEQQQDD
ncbi:MAG: hypothetical protein WD355_07595 [Balneolaceae bacterium]